MSDVPWVAWPGLLKDVARVAGSDAAFRLAMELGGTEIHVPKAAYLRSAPDHPIVQAIGVTAATAVANEIGHGESMYVPRARRPCVQVLKARGASTREVAARLQISPQAVRAHWRRR